MLDLQRCVSPERCHTLFEGLLPELASWCICQDEAPKGIGHREDFKHPYAPAIAGLGAQVAARTIDE